MIQRALAALALGGSLLILLPCTAKALEARQTTVQPEIIQRYQQALANDPGNLTLRYLLGVTLLQNGQDAAALSELQIAYPAYQGSIEANYNLAVASLRLNDLASTEIYLEQAAALGATDMPGVYPLAGLYFNMALKSLESGDPNEAIRYFHKALALDPERYEVHRQLGDLYAHRNETELAIKSFRAYLERFPDDPVSRDYLFALEFNRAQDALAANELDSAEISFSSLLELQPDSPTTLYYLGYIAYTRQQPGLAAEFLLQAFRNADDTLQQTIRPLLYNTALLLRKSAKLVQALNAVTVLADQKHALFNELLLAGTLNLDLAQYRLANAYLQRALALQPGEPRALQNTIAAEVGAFNEWITIAKLELHDDNLDKAAEALGNAHQLQPQSSRVTTLGSRIEQARIGKAAAYFEQAREAFVSGDLTTAHDRVASGLLLQPHNKDGLALREEIGAASAADLEQLMIQADQAVQAGRLEEARLAYDKILAVTPRHPEALEGSEQVTLLLEEQIATLLEEGRLALDSGRMEQADSAYARVLSLAPDNAEAQEGLVNVRQVQANRFDELLVKGRQALGRDEFDKAREWFHQAMAIDSSATVMEELQELDQQVRKKTDELSVQADRASHAGNFRQAAKLYRQALALNPEHESSLAGRKMLAGQVEATISKHMQEADKARQNADYAAAMSAYRSILEIEPDHNAALEGLNNSRKQQAEDLARLVSQGEAALNRGDLDEARKFLSAALLQDAYHGEAQRLRQRLDMMQQAGAQPGDEQKLYLQGVAHYTQGRYTDAIKSWETVLLLDPEHEKSRQNIAKTRLKLQQIKEYSGG